MATGTTLSRREFLVHTAGVAAAATVATGLASCTLTVPAVTDPGAEAPAMEPITLTMWKGPHKAAGDETKLCAQPTLDVLQEMTPGLVVDFSEIPWGQYNEKFTAAFAADAGPDVSYQTESFPRFVNAGHIMALDDMIDASDFERTFFYERAWGPGTYDGITYSLPWIIGGSNLFWNKDLFEQAGLDPDTPPDTLEEFLSYAQAITALDEDIYGFASSPRDWHENSQWPRRFGGHWFNELARNDLDRIREESPVVVLLMHTHGIADDYEHTFRLIDAVSAHVGQQPGATFATMGELAASSALAQAATVQGPDNLPV